MARTIYTDYETEEILNKKKRDDPEFNLSQFLKEKLLGDLEDKSKHDIVDLSNRLEKAKFKELEARQEQDYIRQKIEQVKLTIKEDLDVEKIKERRKGDINELKKIIEEGIQNETNKIKN